MILNKGKIGDNGPDFDFRADIKSNPNKRADNVVKNQLQFANFVLVFDCSNCRVNIKLEDKRPLIHRFI